MSDAVWKAPFRFKGIHACEAVVLTCIDFRFHDETAYFVEEVLGIKSFDFPSLPGGTKAIIEHLAMECVRVPVELHKVKDVILVHHEDCGAYGGSSKFGGDTAAEQRFHENELQEARDIIRAKHPNIQISLVYIRLTRDKEEMEFLSM